MKKFAFLAVAAALVFAGCDKNDDPNDNVVPVESVELNNVELTLFEGAEATLVATVKPDNATNKEVKWESNNPTVATVADGVVKAVKEGNATITVTTADGAKTAKCNVTVKQKVNFTVSFDVHELDAKAGEGLTLNATVTPADAEYVIGWCNENPDAAVLVQTSQKNTTGVSVKKIAVSEAAEITITVQIYDPADRMTPLATDSCKIYVNYHEYDDHFYYMGENYKTVALKDGNVWMAENLRYVPEDKTVSSDYTVDDGLWYPAKADKVADPSLVKTKGLLYDCATAFGVSAITEENAYSFEGKQGICPKGWHIPTNAELTGLVGHNANGALTNTSAPYYDANVKGASIPVLDEAGFNWTFVGYRNKTAITAKGAYNCTVYENTVGALSWVLGSTCYQVKKGTDGTITNYQFYSLMSTVNKTNNKVSVAYGNFLSGLSVRCVKNK